MKETIPENAVCIDEHDAKVLWEAEAEAFNVSNQCGHVASGAVCEFKSSKSKCTYKWSVNDCLILTGYTTALYEAVLAPDEIVLQMGKISYFELGNELTIAGLYLSAENCPYAIDDLFLHLKENYVK